MTDEELLEAARRLQNALHLTGGVGVETIGGAKPGHRIVVYEDDPGHAAEVKEALDSLRDAPKPKNGPDSGL